MTFKKIVVIVLAGMSCMISSHSQEYTRRIVKAYPVNNSSTIDIYNKYGKIHVVTWEKDSVRFEIDLKINATSDSRLNKLRKNIDFDFTGTSYYVIAKTIIGSDSPGLLSDLKDIAETLISSGNQVTINYTVMVPAYANLKMENKFGDVYIDDHSGNLNLTLSNGELKANNLYGNTVINLSSGDGLVNHIKDGKLSVSYSDFRLRKAERLQVDSRSSRITLEEAGFLNLSSRHDKYTLPELNEFYGDSYWSDFTIKHLEKEMNFNFRYGSLSVENIARTFSFISLSSEYTDMSLIFGQGSTYGIDIIHHEDVLLNYPKQLANLESKVINVQDKQVLTFGKIGFGNSKSKVKITALKKCNLTIVHK